jgi:hypothetical protein
MHRKAEKFIQNAMIASFLRLDWLWGQKFGYLKMLSFVQNRISAARSTSKTHKSYTADRMRACE